MACTSTPIVSKDLIVQHDLLDRKNKFSEGVYYDVALCQIILVGEIGNDFSAKIQRLDGVMRKSGGCVEMELLLASRGGNVFPAMVIGGFIRENKYTTSIMAGSECTSSCGLIYIAGSIRMVNSNDNVTRLGLHKPSVVRQGFRECIEYDQDISFKEKYKKYLVEMLGGSSAEKYYKISNGSSCTNVTYMYGKDLLTSEIANKDVRH